MDRNRMESNGMESNGMEINQTWMVLLETPNGKRQSIPVSYPRQPTKDFAAGFARMALGMPISPPREYRDQEDASLRALEGAGYRLLGVRLASH
ncbi:hypothetical protein [Alloalcanivorax gelatiniphagus]|uniref:Uncharacterized protein n=1 Tax=Alloalcanivorax gelatiniphagus TaxID=1194167 RepID=A0ABY2XMH0_9GAMM|nr:hypothetical protein [Alloalcanivorax gelatiniphagus]TMW13597.1 hypothetical protein FGS76_05545 [Alloalcanivorax gelatiniphagus]|tara:strand:- start:6845 stop:7126 length:282 start_codon:yes stop_codon:yes gene_type:complete